MPIIRVIFGRPLGLQVTVRFMIRVVLSVLSVCLSVCLSVTLVYCGRTVGWIEMSLGAEVGLGLSDTVLDGDSGLPRKGAQQPPPHFSAHVYCGQTARWIRIPLGTEVSLSPGDIVLDGDRAPPRKGAQQPPLFGPLCSGTVAHLSNC